MSDNSTDDIIRATTVRLEHELHRQVEDAAEAADRSVSAEIRRRLRESFRRQPDQLAAS